MYETLWVRAFTDLFGAGAPAAAATVAAMFAGMALGSEWFGARAARFARPLRAYAWLELGAGGAATLVPLAGRAYARLAPALHAGGASPALIVASKTALVFAALVVPTFLLGGTLPLAVAALDGRALRGRRAGALYAANTAGAVAGVLSVPYVLLPALGARGAYALALAGSAALGGVALLLARRGAAAAVAPASAADAQPIARSLAFQAGASGFLLLGLEVAWMRMLAQVHPSSLQAFACVLAVFLGALALGAALGARLARSADVARALRRSWLAAGLLTLVGPLAFDAWTRGLDRLAGGGAELVLAGLIGFGPAALAGGLVLPLLISAGAERSSAEAATGRLLAASTVGSVLGPLVTGFVLFPLLGLWRSVAVLGLAQLALAAVTRGAFALRLLTLVVGALLARSIARLPRVHVDATRGEELVWLREGSHGIAAAVQRAGHLRLKLDNSYTLGGTATAGDARQLGHVPLLLHPAPRRVAFLGLGTGLTASAVMRHPEVEEVIAFELVPEVAEAARTVFAAANLGVLADPRVALVLDDARSALGAKAERFDVVVGDLVVPWRRGESALLTREHFETARAALAPGGLFCQWLPLYQMTAEELAIVVATFRDVFPDACAWRGDFVAEAPALGLLGGRDAPPLDVRAIDARARARSSALVADNGYLADPAGLWLYLVGPLPAGGAAGETRRSTRDRPVLEWLRRAGPGAREPFTGMALSRHLDALGAGPETGLLAALDGEHRRWRDLGGDLFRASSMDAAGDEPGARELAFRTLDALPAALRTALLGPEEGAPTGR